MSSGETTVDGAVAPGPVTGPRSGESQDASERGAIRELVCSMQASNRRLQLIVFPSVFAFALLAAYGFYMVSSLVEDVDKMATSIYLNMGFMAERMNQISNNLDELSGSVREISVNLDDLTGNMRIINGTLLKISEHVETLPPMLATMQSMDSSVRALDASVGSMDVNVGKMTTSVQSMNQQMAALTATTQHIGANVSGMNQSFGRPMSFMNSFMPW